MVADSYCLRQAGATLIWPCNDCAVVEGYHAGTRGDLGDLIGAFNCGIGIGDVNSKVL